MPLSKINRPGLNTGIADNSDATAITIDSSERVGIGTVSPSQEIHGYSSGGDFSLRLESASSTGTAYTYYKNADQEYQIGIRGSASDSFQIIDTTADAARFVMDTGGRVTMPNQPSFLARGITGQPAVGSVFVFNGTDYNRGNHYSTSNGRFTAPVDGFYMFTCHVMGDSTNNRLMIRLFKNGTHMTQGSSSSNGSQYQDSRIAFMMYMASGDYAEVKNQGNKNRYDNGATHNHFAGHLLG